MGFSQPSTSLPRAFTMPRFGSSMTDQMNVTATTGVTYGSSIDARDDRPAAERPPDDERRRKAEPDRQQGADDAVDDRGRHRVQEATGRDDVDEVVERERRAEDADGPQVPEPELAEGDEDRPQDRDDHRDEDDDDGRRDEDQAGAVLLFGKRGHDRRAPLVACASVVLLTRSGCCLAERVCDLLHVGLRVRCRLFGRRGAVQRSREVLGHRELHEDGTHERPGPA